MVIISFTTQFLCFHFITSNVVTITNFIVVTYNQKLLYIRKYLPIAAK